MALYQDIGAFTEDVLKKTWQLFWKTERKGLSGESSSLVAFFSFFSVGGTQNLPEVEFQKLSVLLAAVSCLAFLIAFERVDTSIHFSINRDSPIFPYCQTIYNNFESNPTSTDQSTAAVPSPQKGTREKSNLPAVL